MRSTRTHVYRITVTKRVNADYRYVQGDKDCILHKTYTKTQKIINLDFPVSKQFRITIFSRDTLIIIIGEITVHGNPRVPNCYCSFTNCHIYYIGIVKITD